jgi:hypothetical protein
MQWWKRAAPALMLVLPMVQAQAQVAHAAMDTVTLPFDTGAAVQVIQGYNGGTHQEDSRFGLDIVLADQPTSGAPVLSPLDGSVALAFDPGDKTGCIEVVQPERAFGVMLCHVLLDRPYSRGERVSRGQVLGTVGAPGTVGNNGAAHVHIELHQAGRSSDPVPFSPSDKRADARRQRSARHGRRQRPRVGRPGFDERDRRAAGAPRGRARPGHHAHSAPASQQGARDALPDWRLAQVHAWLRRPERAPG